MTYLIHYEVPTQPHCSRALILTDGTGNKTREKLSTIFSPGIDRKNDSIQPHSVLGIGSVKDDVFASSSRPLCSPSRNDQGHTSNYTWGKQNSIEPRGGVWNPDHVLPRTSSGTYIENQDPLKAKRSLKEIISFYDDGSQPKPLCMLAGL